MKLQRLLSLTRQAIDDYAMIEEGVEIIEAAPEGSHKPVIYPAAILKDAENKELANDFLEYLKSDEALEVFENYGFGKAK